MLLFSTLEIILAEGAVSIRSAWSEVSRYTCESHKHMCTKTKKTWRRQSTFQNGGWPLQVQIGTLAKHDGKRQLSNGSPPPNGSAVERRCPLACTVAVICISSGRPGLVKIPCLASALGSTGGPGRVTHFVTGPRTSTCQSQYCKSQVTLTQPVCPTPRSDSWGSVGDPTS